MSRQPSGWTACAYPGCSNGTYADPLNLTTPAPPAAGTAAATKEAPMPRRNRPPRNKPRPRPLEDATLKDVDPGRLYEALAAALVAEGLASVRILEHRQHNESKHARAHQENPC